jgi:hypothetical protein
VREDPVHRLRDVQLRELPALVVALLGRSMGRSSNCSNQGTLPMPDRVGLTKAQLKTLVSERRYGEHLAQPHDIAWIVSTAVSRQ